MLTANEGGADPKSFPLLLLSTGKPIDLDEMCNLIKLNICAYLKEKSEISILERMVGGRNFPASSG